MKKNCDKIGTIHYESPQLKVIILDNKISLILASTNELPPTHEDEVNSTPHHNPFGSMKYNQLA